MNSDRIFVCGKITTFADKINKKHVFANQYQSVNIR